MTERIRMGGPQGVKRPYTTLPQTNEPLKQIAQALDHIAVVLSAMDHNIEQMAADVRKLAKQR